MIVPSGALCQETLPFMLSRHQVWIVESRRLVEIHNKALQYGMV